MTDPKTREEWQKAVDMAAFYLAVDSAKKYGLTIGGGEIDARRCEELIEAGRKQGIVPAPDAIERGIAALMKEGKAGG